MNNLKLLTLVYSVVFIGCWLIDASALFFAILCIVGLFLMDKTYVQFKKDVQK